MTTSRWRVRLIGLAIAIAALIGPRAAFADLCTAPTPACHLDNGKELLTADPKRAADELLASFQLDERTDTLVLYAIALQLDHQYAAALEAWKRVIVFRDSELEAANQTARTATGRKRAAAKATAARAQKQSEQAAEAIIKLWPSVGRVRVRVPAGQQIAVTRGGVEVDPSRDVLVNAGGDELTFTRRDGSVARVAVEVAAGSVATIDAPPPGAKPAASTAIAKAEPAAKPEPAVVAKPEPAKPAPAAKPAAISKLAPAAKPEVAVKPVPSAKPAAQPEASEAGDGDEVPLTGLADTRSVDQPRSLTMSRVGLGFIAGGVLAGGLAGGLAYVASRDYDRSRDAGCSADGQCPFGPAADLARQSNDRARLAQITAVGAVALAATGATLWFVGRRTTHRTITDVALHVGPSSTAISGRF